MTVSRPYFTLAFIALTLSGVSPVTTEAQGNRKLSDRERLTVFSLRHDFATGPSLVIGSPFPHYTVDAREWLSNL